MKNIAIIVPTLNKGGAERVAANMSIEFSKYYNVFIIVYDGRNITYPYKGTLIKLDVYPTRNIIKKIINLVKRIKFVKRIKKEYKIDYSISHLPSCNLVNILSKYHDKTYTYIHTMLRATLKLKIREKINCRFSDKVICVSECVRRNMIDNFKLPSQKLLTIYNFSNLQKNIEQKKHTSKSDNELLIVTMGRLIWQKGQWHLLKAFKYAMDRNPNIKLKIYGVGELEEKLNNIIKKLKLNNNVIMCGYIENPFTELVKGDIYVSSSVCEGLPMALVEAASCNLPIISTDCDAGCREILAPDTPIDKKTEEIEYAKYGVLVPVCNNGTIDEIKITKEEIILGEAILNLCKDKTLREKYAKLSKQRSKDFTPDKIIKKWQKILK